MVLLWLQMETRELLILVLCLQIMNSCADICLWTNEIKTQSPVLFSFSLICCPSSSMMKVFFLTSVLTNKAPVRFESSHSRDKCGFPVVARIPVMTPQLPIDISVSPQLGFESSRSFSRSADSSHPITSSHWARILLWGHVRASCSVFCAAVEAHFEYFSTVKKRARLFAAVICNRPSSGRSASNFSSHEWVFVCWHAFSFCICRSGSPVFYVFSAPRRWTCGPSGGKSISM